jgi:hypothetical protein
MRLLHEDYEENGIVFYDKDVNITTPPVTDHLSCVTCNICVSSIPDIDIHYYCGICSDADFCICQECIATGAFCLDRSHKRMIKMVLWWRFLIN